MRHDAGDSPIFRGSFYHKIPQKTVPLYILKCTPVNARHLIKYVYPIHILVTCNQFLFTHSVKSLFPFLRLYLHKLISSIMNSGEEIHSHQVQVIMLFIPFTQNLAHSLFSFYQLVASCKQADIFYLLLQHHGHLSPSF